MLVYNKHLHITPNSLNVVSKPAYILRSLSTQNSFFSRFNTALKDDSIRQQYKVKLYVGMP